MKNNDRRIITPYMRIDDLLYELKEKYRIGYYDWDKLADDEDPYIPKSTLDYKTIYRTISPSLFERCKVGDNMDYTEFLSQYFTQYHESKYETYMLEVDNGFCYTFLIYPDNGNYYIVIPEGFLPVDGVVKEPNRSKAIQFIVNVIMGLDINRNHKYVVFRYDTTGEFGLTESEFIDQRWILRFLVSSNASPSDISSVFTRFYF